MCLVSRVPSGRLSHHSGTSFSSLQRSLLGTDACFLVWHYVEGTVTSLAGSTPLECVGGGLAHTWDLSACWVLQSLTH